MTISFFVATFSALVSFTGAHLRCTNTLTTAVSHATAQKPCYEDPAATTSKMLVD